MFKILNRDTQKMQSKECVVANIAEEQQQKFNKQATKKANFDARAVEQTQIKLKYNKSTTLIRSLSSLYIWKQHGIPEYKKQLDSHKIILIGIHKKYPGQKSNNESLYC